MQAITDVGLNLIAGLLGFLIGAVWNFSLHAARNSVARRIWRPFAREHFYIVVPRFFREVTFEPSGFLGVGDGNALNELRSHFDRIGVRQFSIEYADAFPGNKLKSNLILLGGPDGNQVTELVFSRITPRLTFQNYRQHVVTVLDEVTGNKYSPLMLDQGEVRPYIRGTPADELTQVELIRDYGMIVGCPNPFAPDKRVLVVAGSFGYGTWAGIRFAVSRQFVRQPLVGVDGGFEALVEADIAKGEPQDISLVTIRPMHANAATATG